MKRTSTFAFIVMSIAVATACSPQPASAPRDTAAAAGETPGTTADQEIRQLEDRWVAAILAKDTATIERILADDFVGTTNDTRYSKREAVADVRDGVHDMLRLDNVEVRLYGDTAVVDIDQTEKSRHGTDDFSGSYMFTDVWVKQNGRWEAVSSHGSRTR